MELRDTTDEAAFRQEVRDFIAANLPDGSAKRGARARGGELAALQRGQRVLVGHGRQAEAGTAVAEVAAVAVEAQLAAGSAEDYRCAPSGQSDSPNIATLCMDHA